MKKFSKPVASLKGRMRARMLSTAAICVALLAIASPGQTLAQVGGADMPLDLRGHWEAYGPGGPGPTWPLYQPGYSHPFKSTMDLTLVEAEFNTFGPPFIFRYLGELDLYSYTFERVGCGPYPLVQQCVPAQSHRIFDIDVTIAWVPFSSGEGEFIIDVGKSTYSAIPRSENAWTHDLNPLSFIIGGRSPGFEEGEFPSLAMNFSWTGDQTPGERYDCLCGILMPNSYSVVRYDYHNFRPTSAFPGFPSATSDLSGRVISADPVFTVNLNDVHVATIELLRQVKGYMREQGVSESDEDYAAYLQTKPLVSMGRVAIDEPDMGHFTFPDMPFFDQGAVAESGRTATVLYTLRVTGAQSEEVLDFEDPPRRRTALFAGKELRNLNPVDLGDIGLTVLGEVATKRNLINQISELGPVNYADVEAEVDTYITTLFGDILTDAELEGVRRAIIAEIIVREGADRSRDLIGLMVESFGNLISQLIEFIDDRKSDGKLDRLKAEEMKAHAAKSLKNISPAERTRLTGVLNNWVNAGTREAISQVAVILKGMLWSGKLLIEDALILSGQADSDAAETADFIYTILEGILDTAITQSFGGIIDEIVKAAIAKAEVLLMDSPLPVSYTARTRPSLLLSRDRMQNWSTADPDAFVADRDASYRRLKNLYETSNTAFTLASLGVAITSGMDTIEATSGALGSEALRAGRKAPVLKWVDIIVKAAKLLGNATAFIATSENVFVYIPAMVRLGTCHAYGLFDQVPGCFLIEFGLQAESGQPLALNLGVSTHIRNEVSARSTMLQNEITALVALLDTDDLPGMIDAAFADEDSFQSALDAFQVYVQGAQIQSSPPGLTQTWILQRDMRDANIRAFTVAAAETRQALGAMLLDRVALRLTGTSDPDYLAERRRVRDKLNRLVTQAQTIASSFQVLPLNMAGASVILDLPVLSSEDTGNSNISQSPETFTVKTTVTNLSDIAIAELGFELDIADDVNFTINSANPLQLPGDLLANDGAPGGGDSVDLSWTFTYSGTASLQPPVGMSINPVTGTGTSDELSLVGLNLVIFADPTVTDSDNDGFTLVQETGHGLNPNLDEAYLDADEDGLDTQQELLFGTLPGDSDSDNDELLDGEELTAGADGFITDPLDADSDDDGTSDGLDGDPLNALSTDPTPGRTAGITLSQTLVQLSQDTPSVTVNLKKTGNGSVAWTTAASRPSVAFAAGSSAQQDDGLIIVTTPTGFDFNYSGVATSQIHVYDVQDPIAISKTISVEVIGNASPAWTTIRVPVPPAELPSNEIIVLEGAAQDPQGADASTAINWSSDIQGALGTGASLNLELHDGAHLITASVDYGVEGIASDQIALLVIDGSVIFTNSFE